MKFGKATLFAFTLFALSGFMFASNPTSQLKTALSDLCKGLRDLVPVAAMLMVLLASVIYATGQMMGAETRARANVWATSALTGALIGILISVVAPAVLQVIAGQNSTIQC
ncbi:MAG: hypothetical protein WC263_02380 [Candidatus Micrarchaeia archaeon]